METDHRWLSRMMELTSEKRPIVGLWRWTPHAWRYCGCLDNYTNPQSLGEGTVQCCHNDCPSELAVHHYAPISPDLLVPGRLDGPGPLKPAPQHGPHHRARNRLVPCLKHVVTRQSWTEIPALLAQIAMVVAAAHLHNSFTVCVTVCIDCAACAAVLGGVEKLEQMGPVGFFRRGEKWEFRGLEIVCGHHRISVTMTVQLNNSVLQRVVR